MRGGRLGQRQPDSQKEDLEKGPPNAQEISTDVRGSRYRPLIPAPPASTSAARAAIAAITRLMVVPSLGSKRSALGIDCQLDRLKGRGERIPDENGTGEAGLGHPPYHRDSWGVGDCARHPRRIGHRSVQLPHPSRRLLKDIGGLRA